MKAGKEAIVGAMAALEYRASQDMAAWTAEQDRKVQRILDHLAEVTGLALGVDPDPNDPNDGNGVGTYTVTVHIGDQSYRRSTGSLDPGLDLMWGTAVAELTRQLTQVNRIICHCPPDRDLIQNRLPRSTAAKRNRMALVNVSAARLHAVWPIGCSR